MPALGPPTPLLALVRNRDARGPHGRVVERQTRWLQEPVPERVWGFKSPLAHEIDYWHPAMGSLYDK
jgi:hypothetical protein